MRLSLCIILALMLTACYKNESSTTDTLLYCLENFPKSFNPQISHDVATLDATTHQLYNRLVKRDPTTNRFIPDLAKKWVINKDKTQYTFSLKKQVPFHNTDYFTPSRHLNADDVIFSFERILQREHPFHSINNNFDVDFVNHPFASLIANIVKVDEYTVQIYLNKPDATLLSNLAAPYSVVLSQEYGQQLINSDSLKKIDFYPIGTGPFKFKNKTNHDIIRYQAHVQDWQTTPAIDNLIFDVTPDKTKRYTKLLSGECDTITYPAPSQLKHMTNNSNISISSQPTSNTSIWAFNSKKAPFDHRSIRQAFSYAVNKETILDAVFLQSAMKTNTLLREQSWARDLRSLPSKQNVEAAIKLLKANRFDFDKVFTILIPIQNSIYNPNYYKTAELIQANLLEIGVRTKIVALQARQLEQRLLSGDYDTYLTGINSQINDPDSLFRPLLSCNVNPLEGNSSQWCRKDVQQLLDSALLESNFIARIKYYYRLQRIIQEERIYYPIAHVLRIDAINNNISGVVVNPLTGINFINAFKIEAQ